MILTFYVKGVLEFKYSILLVNTFRPALVLVPTGLSRHQSGVGTSTKPIFISLLKKKVLGVMASGLYH